MERMTLVPVDDWGQLARIELRSMGSHELARAELPFDLGRVPAVPVYRELADELLRNDMVGVAAGLCDAVLAFLGSLARAAGSAIARRDMERFAFRIVGRVQALVLARRATADGVYTVRTLLLIRPTSAALRLAVAERRGVHGVLTVLYSDARYERPVTHRIRASQLLLEALVQHYGDVGSPWGETTDLETLLARLATPMPVVGTLLEQALAPALRAALLGAEMLQFLDIVFGSASSLDTALRRTDTRSALDSTRQTVDLIAEPAEWPLQLPRSMTRAETFRLIVMLCVATRNPSAAAELAAAQFGPDALPYAALDLDRPPPIADEDTAFSGVRIERGTDGSRLLHL